MTSIRAVHYLNQFFAGLGGEEQAGVEPACFDGARGPGLLLQRLAPEIEIVSTAKLLAESIRRINNEESVSSLFG